jgi:hypothetical protein
VPATHASADERAANKQDRQGRGVKSGSRCRTGAVLFVAAVRGRPRGAPPTTGDDPRWNPPRATDLATKAATGAPTEGRVLYAPLRALPVPEEPVARLWHAVTLLREHRGDGHIAALVAEGIGGTEAHVLHALLCCMLSPRASPRTSSAESTTSPRCGWPRLSTGMRARGLVEASGWISDAGREGKQRIESLTDDLAAPAYDRLTPSEQQGRPLYHPLPPVQRPESLGPAGTATHKDAQGALGERTVMPRWCFRLSQITWRTSRASPDGGQAIIEPHGLPDVPRLPASTPVDRHRRLHRTVSVVGAPDRRHSA